MIKQIDLFVDILYFTSVRHIETRI